MDIGRGRIDGAMTKQSLKASAGSIFMVTCFSILWAALMLLGFGTNPVSIAGLVLLLACDVWLYIRAIRTMRAIHALPDLPLDENVKREQRRIGRSFGIIFGIEAVLIMAASMLIESPDYIGPVIALIVGLHFYPLSALFRVRAHAILATPIVLVAVISIIVVSTGQWIGPMVGICCLVTAICTAIMSAYLLRFVDKGVQNLSKRS